MSPGLGVGYFGADDFGAQFGPASSLERDMLAAPETRLLLLAGRAEPPPDLEECVASAQTAGIDWPAFLGLARSHRLTPHVARSLSGCGGLPGEVRAALEEMGRRTAVRSLHTHAAARRVVDALAGAGIPSLGFKGPALAHWLYGDVTRRMYVDLDMLVQREAIGDAIAVVGAIGLRPLAHPLTPNEVAVAADAFHVHDAAFLDPEHGVKLELHWRAFNDPVYREIERLLQAEVPRPESGHSTAVMAAHVLMHGAHHGYRRLGWLVDAGSLLGRLDTTDWQEVLRIAAADRVGNAVLLGPYLAHRLLGASIPPALEEPLRLRRLVLVRLAELAQMRTPDLFGIERPGVLRLEMLLRDRRWDRLRFVANKAARPTRTDMNARTLRPGWRGRWSRLAIQGPRLTRFAMARIGPRLRRRRVRSRPGAPS